MAEDNFIIIPFTITNLDRYVMRKSILHAINQFSASMTGALLDAGCGKMPYREYILNKSSVTKYIGLDIESALNYDEIKPDHTWDGIRMPFDDNSFESVMATEVLEHIHNPREFLDEVRRVLKPNGKLFFTVPFLWNLHEVPHDHYRYTPFALREILLKSSFKNIELHPMGGWHRSMAQMLGLWVRRAGFGKIMRNVLSLILQPIIGYLLLLENKKEVKFTEGQMITGLYGIAQK